MTAAIALSPFAPAHAGSATGAATEWTQLANNAQLIDLLKSSGLQVDNQLTQITQLAEQIQNQLKIYENMLQNTAQLPDHIWGQVESDLNRLRSIVDQGHSISFSMGNGTASGFARAATTPRIPWPGSTSACCRIWFSPPYWGSPTPAGMSASTSWGE